MPFFRYRLWVKIKKLVLFILKIVKMQEKREIFTIIVDKIVKIAIITLYGKNSRSI